MSKSKISNDLSARSKGFMIVLSAPSGCGKTTLGERLLKRHEDWVRSISVTTRKPRDNEKTGVDYFFVTPAEFKKMESGGGLLESALIFDHWYGTPKAFIDKKISEGEKVLLAIDVQGAAKIKKVLKGRLAVLTIFILPPSVKVLRERLEGRQTESSEEIARRILRAEKEIKEAGWYDFTVVNQTLDQTISEIEGFIEKFQKERRFT